MKVGNFFYIMFFSLVAQDLPTVTIKPLDGSYYQGGKALVELTIFDDIKIIKKDSRLQDSENIVVNRFSQGKFSKHYLTRYEILLTNSGVLKLDSFILQKGPTTIELEVEPIEVLAEAEVLHDTGARLVSNNLSPYVGEKFIISYEVLIDSDHKLVDYRVPTFAPEIEILSRREEKYEKRFRQIFEVVSKKSGNYIFDSAIFSAAKLGSIAHFMGFGKTYSSNSLQIEVLPVGQDVTIVGDINLPEVTLSSSLTKTDILTCISKGFFIDWPKLEISQGEAKIYRSGTKSESDFNSCTFVVQPVKDGELSILLTGNIFDPALKKTKPFAISKSAIVSVPYVSTSDEPEQLKIKPIWYKPINWLYWSLAVLALFLATIYRIFAAGLISNIYYRLKKFLQKKYYESKLKSSNDLIAKKYAKLILNLNLEKDKIKKRLLEELIYGDKL